MNNVKEKLETISLDDFEGKLDDVIRFLLKTKKLYKDKTEVSLVLRSKEYCDGQEFVVVHTRPENEKEIAQRESEEKRRLEYRKAEYERLKKEFEK